MAVLSDVVSVTISADSRTPSSQGFGIPLVMAYHTRFTDLSRSYTALSEMITDGFTTYDDAYRMAGACFAQDPAPSSIVVGRGTVAPAYITTLTITSAVENAIVKCTVIEPTTGTAVPLTYTILAGATTTTVATAMELLIEAVTGVSSSSAVADITVTPAVAGRRVHIYGLQNCTIQDSTTTATGYSTDVTALVTAGEDTWYMFSIDTAASADIQECAAYALANKKLFFASTNASNELSGSGTLGSDLIALTNDRAVILYSPNSHEFGATAWAAVGAAKPPGSITWAFKALAGVTAGSLTTTQKNFLEADNINHYQSLAGLAVTRPGKVTSGEWIDIRHGIDALEARIKEDVYAVLANADKVPFTDAGLDGISSTIYGALHSFEGSPNTGGLLVQGSSVVTMPLVSSISAANKALRRLTGVRFAADLEGAVHYVSITGVLSV